MKRKIILIAGVLLLSLNWIIPVQAQAQKNHFFITSKGDTTIISGTILEEVPEKLSEYDAKTAIKYQIFTNSGKKVFNKNKIKKRNVHGMVIDVLIPVYISYENEEIIENYGEGKTNKFDIISRIIFIIGCIVFAYLFGTIFGKGNSKALLPLAVLSLIMAIALIQTIGLKTLIPNYWLWGICSILTVLGYIKGKRTRKKILNGTYKGVLKKYFK